MAAIRKKLGELLVEAGIIDEMKLQTALSYQKEWGGRLGAVLIRKGFIKEQDMIAVIEKQMAIKCVRLEDFEKPSEEVMSLVTEDIARKFGILPQKFDGRTLLMATSDPTDLKTLDDLGFLLSVPVRPVLALESDIRRAIDHFYNPVSANSTLERRAKVTEIPFAPKGVRYDLVHADAPQEPGRDNKDLSTSGIDHTVIAAIVDLLVEKSIFTRDELAERINMRKG